MERDARPQAAGQEHVAVGRGQNTILTLPHDAVAIRHVLALLFERLDAAEPMIRAVVLAADVETVLAIGRVAAGMERPEGATILAVPSAQRGARALREAAPALLIATPDDLLALLRASLAKLHEVRTVVFAWAEDLLAFDDAPLATVMAELPKEAARILVTARLTPDVEAFAERYVRRIVRSAAAPGELAKIGIWYVTVAASARPSALRRVLDTLDPESATVFARTDDGGRDARMELSGMGSAARGVTVVTDPAPIESSALVLYELPTTAADLRTLTSGTVQQVVALVRGREMPLLHSLTASTPRPLALGGPAERARAREAATRDALRAVLADGVPPRELLALEPLLEEYDGVEIAAAALKLLERARETRPVLQAPSAPTPALTATVAATPDRSAASAPHGTVRVFINAGSRDGATARDFVGAIANVAAIPADRIGKVDVRESHALVELQAADAESVVEKLAGATIRGRRISPRLDRDRAAGERPRDTRGGGGKRSPDARGRAAGGAERRERSPVSRGRGAPARERPASRERGGSYRERGSERVRDRGKPAGRERSPSPRGRRPT